MDLLVRGGAGGLLFFMIKQKIIRDKVRYCNLSNNMMIISKQLQFKYNNSQARLCSSQASWWADGTHDHHNSVPELAEHPPPYQIMLDPSLFQYIKIIRPSIMYTVPEMPVQEVGKVQFEYQTPSQSQRTAK
jgi:hypothetical protein